MTYTEVSEFLTEQPMETINVKNEIINERTTGIIGKSKDVLYS